MTIERGVPWAEKMYFLGGDKEKHQSFQYQLLASESSYRLHPYACAVSGLPENQPFGETVWNQELSDDAKCFLKSLDKLHLRKPTVAVKIAAIVASVTGPHRVLGKEARQRCCDWIRSDVTPRQARIELGLSILRFWPNSRNGFEEFEDLLLDLCLEEVPCDPMFVRNCVVVAEEGSSKRREYVFSLFDNPAKLLRLGGGLKEIAPETTKDMLRTFLYHARLKIRNLSASEAILRCVATELFDLESRYPEQVPVVRGAVYATLVQCGYPNESWWPTAIERLMDDAGKLDTQHIMGDWLSAAAINSQLQVSLSEATVKRLVDWINTYRLQPESAWLQIRVLLKTIESTCNDFVGCARNPSIPARSDYPIVKTLTDLYWACIDWLRPISIPSCLHTLALGVTCGEEDLSMESKKLLLRDFQQLVFLDVGAAESLVWGMAHSSVLNYSLSPQR